MSEPKRLFDIQLELLNTELTHISGAIRQHDEITKSIKNWAVVTWTASIGFSLKEPTLHPFVWLTAIIPVVFWIVDGSFRRIQRTFISRTREISDFLNSPTFRGAAENGTHLEFPLMLMRRKTNEFRDSLPGTMLFRSVALLYVGLTLCSLVVWLIARK